MTTSLSKIWENTDGSDEQYRFTSAIYLISVMSQCYSFITDWVISSPGNGKEVVDGLNAIDKRYLYIYQLMSNGQLPGSKIIDYHIQMHINNQNNDLSLTR